MNLELKKCVQFKELFNYLATQKYNWEDLETDEDGDIIYKICDAITIATAKILDSAKNEDVPKGYGFVKDFDGNIYFGAVVEYKKEDKSWKFYYVTNKSMAPENTEWISCNHQAKTIIDNCLFDIARIQLVPVSDVHETVEQVYAESLMNLIEDNINPDSPELDIVYDDLLRIHAVIGVDDEPHITITPGGQLKQFIKGIDSDK